MRSICNIQLDDDEADEDDEDAQQMLADRIDRMGVASTPSASSSASPLRDMVVAPPSASVVQPNTGDKRKITHTHIKDSDAEFLFGPKADEEEDQNNPVQEDEDGRTGDGWCWACTLDSENKDNAALSIYWRDKIFPLFKTRAPHIVVYTIRDLFNRLVRPHLPPHIKQRWTKRSIFKHIMYDQADVPTMLTHGVRNVGKIMEQAEKEMQLNAAGETTLNVHAAKIYFMGVKLLASLSSQQQHSKPHKRGRFDNG